MSLKVSLVLQPLGRSLSLQAFRQPRALRWHWGAWRVVWERCCWWRWTTSGESLVWLEQDPMRVISIWKYNWILVTKLVACALFFNELKQAATASGQSISFLSESLPPYISSSSLSWTTTFTFELMVVVFGPQVISCFGVGPQRSMTKSLAADLHFKVDEWVDVWIREGAVGIVDAPFELGLIFVSIKVHQCLTLVVWCWLQRV